MCVCWDRYFSNIFPQRKSIFLRSQTRLMQSTSVCFTLSFSLSSRKRLRMKGLCRSACFCSQAWVTAGGQRGSQRGLWQGLPGGQNTPAAPRTAPAPACRHGANQGAPSQSQQQRNPSASRDGSRQVSTLCPGTVMGGSPCPSCPPPFSFSPRKGGSRTVMVPSLLILSSISSSKRASCSFLGMHFGFSFLS